MKNDGVEQQHKNMLENKESNLMATAQRKLPSPTYCDAKRKDDHRCSLDALSKKAKEPEYIMKILTENDKLTRLAGSPSCGKLLVSLLFTNFQIILSLH